MALTLPTSFDIDGVDWTSPDIFDFRVIYALAEAVRERILFTNTRQFFNVNLSPGMTCRIDTIKKITELAYVAAGAFLTPETARTATPKKFTRSDIYQRWPLVMCPPAAGCPPQIYRTLCSQLHDMLQKMIFLDVGISTNAVYFRRQKSSSAEYVVLDTAWSHAAEDFNVLSTATGYAFGRRFEASKRSPYFDVTISGGNDYLIITNARTIPVLRSFYAMYNRNTASFTAEYDFGISFDAGTIYADDPLELSPGAVFTTSQLVDDVSETPPAELTAAAIDEAGGTLIGSVDIAAVDDISPGLRFK